jgi:threonine 3-dehydrogenase
MPEHTRAALWRGGKRVEVVPAPLPTPGAGEVLVRMLLATVCGSDHHTVSGRRTAPCPGVLGHEGVGEVVSCGPGADVLPGERLVWSVTVSCGNCDRCVSGRTAKCRSLRKVGHEAWDSDWPLSGTYAEHLLLPRGATLVRVPPRLPDAVAAPAGCATATVMAALERAVDLAGDLDGRRVLVSGAGMLGLTAAAAASDAGAAEVVVVDPDPARLALARRFGADHGLPPGEWVPPVAVALELSGAARAVTTCLDRLDVGGALVLVGSVAPGPSVVVDPERVVRGWHTLAGVHNYEPRHLRRAVAFLDDSRWPWADLITDPVGLERVAELLNTPMANPRAALQP